MENRLHPRNRHQGRYDFPKLTVSHPELAQYVSKNKYGDLSVDFTNPNAVKALNRALLKDYYGVKDWDIPEGYLCPPIPGRADYIHSIADLMADDHQNVFQNGPGVVGLDIGVGANCIYPLIGHFEYGWSFVGTDINPIAIQAAQAIVDAQEGMKQVTELRLQPDVNCIFRGIVRPNDRFDFTMCNPPYHGSIEEARAGSRRKWRNLGKPLPQHEKQLTNFGGQGAELWCPGGEMAFTSRMIEESVEFAEQIRWFSTMVSRLDELERVYSMLEDAGASECRTFDMAQGQKKSRVVAWCFS